MAASPTLPKGQENDGLDCEELEDGIIRTQEVFSGEVEQE